MRLPVFTDQLGYVRSAKVETHRVEEAIDLFVVAALGNLQLPLGEALQKTAAGLAVAPSACVDALQELVGDGDHYLCHGASIDGIADGQSGHGRDADASERTRGARNVPVL